MCGNSCLCTLSASAFIEPSLHQLDFFLEIFLWRLVSVLFDMRFNLSVSVKLSKLMLVINLIECLFLNVMIGEARFCKQVGHFCFLPGFIAQYSMTTLGGTRMRLTVQVQGQVRVERRDE